MNYRKVIYLLIAIFFYIGYGFAQQVNIFLHRPPNDAVNAENLWWVDIYNMTQDTYDIYLYAYATEESSQDIIFYAYSDTFKLRPGLKRVRPTGGDVHFRNWWVKQAIREAVIRTGAVPEANYECHVEVYAVNQPGILGSITSSIVIQRPTPPRLVAPPNDDSIGRGVLIFSWLPPGNYRGPVSYQIKIVEVIAGQITEEALRSNRAWFEKSNIRTLSLRYPTSARRLESGRRYAWQITANFTVGPFELPIRPLPSEPRSFIKK
jgi:hypothetical protein